MDEVITKTLIEYAGVLIEGLNKYLMLRTATLYGSATAAAVVSGHLQITFRDSLTNVGSMALHTSVFLSTLLSLGLQASGNLIVESDVVHVLPNGSQVEHEDGAVVRVERSADVDGNHSLNALPIVF